MPLPNLPLGRLFWKFLIFFFLAQTTAVLGIGLAIWVTKSTHERPSLPAEAAFAHARPGPGPAGGPPGGDARFLPDVGPPPPEAAGERLPPMPPRPPGPKLPLVHLLAGAVVSLIFAALLAAYVSRPIRRLRQALQAAAAGQLAPGVGSTMGRRRDELADLGRDFDRMAQHLAQLMAGQRRLLYDVSHELRSPLARLSAVIGVARQQPDKFEDCLARLEHESARMDRLISELLTLSRLESGMVERVNEEVALGELLADVVDDAAPEAALAGCTVDLDLPPEATADDWRVRGDPEMLHRVFDNLLRNALKHAASGAWVGISLYRQAAGGDPAGPSYCVEVADRGPGVPTAELAHIFEPFYRGTRANGRNGHGLGLAIVRQIVDNHGGRIVASARRADAAGGGLLVRVCLPALE